MEMEHKICSMIVMSYSMCHSIEVIDLHSIHRRLLNSALTLEPNVDMGTTLTLHGRLEWKSMNLID